MKILLGILIGIVISVPATAMASAKIHDKTEPVGQDSGGRYYRFDDPDFQVKCWRYAAGYKGGLSCLPWDQVKERSN